MRGNRSWRFMRVRGNRSWRFIVLLLLLLCVFCFIFVLLRLAVFVATAISRTGTRFAIDFRIGFPLLWLAGRRWRRTRQKFGRGAHVLVEGMQRALEADLFLRRGLADISIVRPIVFAVVAFILG